MLRRFSKPKIVSLLAVVVGLAGLGAAAMLTTSAQRPASLATVFRPAASPTSPAAKASPSQTTTSSPLPTDTVEASSPAVAGTATQAPKPATTTSTAKPSAPAVTATPASVEYVNLTLKLAGQTSAFKITYVPGIDACSVLEQAKAEGKISSVTIDRSAHNMQSFGSAMVTQINGHSGAGWLYSLTDAAGASLNAPGCSKNPLKAGYSVTWKSV